MTRSFRSGVQRPLRRMARSLLSTLPRDWRFELARRLIDCDPEPDERLQLGIASTQADLEACFSLLHDAYVASGFMKPHPSGLRVTPYHALPTTTTLMARFDGEVVGTLSLVRDGVFGFPMQSAFDVTQVRALGGRVAEVSALAIHPRFRRSGGAILFPLMKFMYEYCTNFFDTRHLVIAVNPNHIEMYEALLFFRRLQAQVVESYDFAGGAPAVGATLDLKRAPERFAAAYKGRSARKDLHRYFTQVKLPNIRFPDRPYYMTNDPVMSPELLDHFFNQRTQGFELLDERRRRLLHVLYPEDRYRPVLPEVDSQGLSPLRSTRRFSLKCPAQLTLSKPGRHPVELEVIDVSSEGFLAQATMPLPDRARGVVRIRLGPGVVSSGEAFAMRCMVVSGSLFYGFRLYRPDADWVRCIAELERRENPAGLPRPLARFDDPREMWTVPGALAV